MLRQQRELGYSMAHQIMGDYCGEGGNMKKAKFHYEAAAKAGQESARFNLGVIEESGKWN